MYITRTEIARRLQYCGACSMVSSCLSNVLHVQYLLLVAHVIVDRLRVTEDFLVRTRLRRHVLLDVLLHVRVKPKQF